MTIQEFFSKGYLFNPSTPRDSKLYLPLILLFGLLIIFACVVKFVPKLKYQKLLDRYFTAFLTTGIFGFLYLFCRYEGLPALGSRFFLLLILVVMAVWITFNTVWAMRFIPKYKKEAKTEERFNKYLPKQKRK